MGCIISLPMGVGCPSQALTSDSFVFNEIPSEPKNCSNINFTTQQEFISDTIEVFIDGKKLDSSDFTVGIDNQSFSLIIDPSDRNGLTKPPSSDEIISVNYIKAPITLSQGCVINIY